MRAGKLRDYFIGAGAKRLSAVDSDPQRSNQHEIGTTAEMRREFLGETQKETFEVTFIWLGEEQDAISVFGKATHYDSRENQPHRAPEWRLYYPSNDVTEIMSEGDTLFLALHESRHLFFIVTPAGSSSEKQLAMLFGIEPSSHGFVSRGFFSGEPELDFAARFILDEIGVEFEDPDADKIDELIAEFDLEFPMTAKFSKKARLGLPEIDARDDPDMALVHWIALEESMFRRLEGKIVGERIRQGFTNADGPDVDSFMSYSLSVQNRRKSRMGHSLENHLKAVFDEFKLPYSHGALTERRKRPDFLFPSKETYLEAVSNGTANLLMLGAKSSCKDRWRQVLAEADKIPNKHLFTLESMMTEAQTEQMMNARLQLVVPKANHRNYTRDQQSWLWSLADFINEVQTRFP